jgi:hypothetical protein
MKSSPSLVKVICNASAGTAAVPRVAVAKWNKDHLLWQKTMRPAHHGAGRIVA